MARYKKILVEKIVEERKAEEEQRNLRTFVGIDDETVIVKKKSITDYIISFIKSIGYFIFIIFVFFGIVLIVNPISRDILLNLFGLS